MSAYGCLPALVIQKPGENAIRTSRRNHAVSTARARCGRRALRLWGHAWVASAVQACLQAAPDCVLLRRVASGLSAFPSHACWTVRDEGGLAHPDTSRPLACALQLGQERARRGAGDGAEFGDQVRLVVIARCGGDACPIVAAF